ncbi:MULTISPECIES: anthranilate 1,2-dioxygenase small subunit [unclassified Pseudomonas]|uniref:anthranilate 1,2-dioxygenase small subunit n=1 Tax=unclassified Pseudomonas TaxID=196821 RepID=UPI00095F0AD8|nr:MULTISPECIES: anthranilate 1,2-dioxygenase small subunit [unclassified Pseudomonas]OLU18407.1 anthranilate 1,2-dioxygenase small subunit [Pseudomonas sp. PA1(2017)]OLU35772.1 anthranilate 1,2-dioxygenase small subunit [Pseudomonas sp. PA27(2017)]
MNPNLHYAVEQFLYRKAALCDAQDWDAYIALFDEDSLFHLPQWISEHEYVQDPQQGLSYIYYADRSGLEDRVFRLRTGKSAASTPLPRTLHQISNLRLQRLDDGQLEAKVGWNTLYTRHGISEQFYGQAIYHLRELGGDDFRISRKHVLLLNDTINSVLDFYHL